MSRWPALPLPGRRVRPCCPRVLEHRRLTEEHQLAVVGGVFSGVRVEALGRRQDELLRLDLVVRLDRHLVAVDAENVPLGAKVRGRVRVRGEGEG